MATPGIVQKVLVNNHEAEYVGPITKNMISDLEAAQMPRWTAYVSPAFNNTYPYYSTIQAAINGLVAKMAADNAGANERGLIAIYPGTYGDFVAANKIDLLAYPGTQINKCDMNSAACTFDCRGSLTYLIGIGSGFSIKAESISYVQATQLVYCSISVREASVINLNGNLTASQIDIESSRGGVSMSISTTSTNTSLTVSANRISDLTTSMPSTTTLYLTAGSVGSINVRNAQVLARTNWLGSAQLTGTGKLHLLGGIVDNSGNCITPQDESCFAATGCWIRSTSGYCISATGAPRISLSDVVMIAPTYSIYSQTSNLAVKIYGRTCANVGAYNCLFSPDALFIDPTVIWWT